MIECCDIMDVHRNVYEKNNANIMFWWLNIVILWICIEIYVKKRRPNNVLMAECCDIMNVHRNIHEETNLNNILMVECYDIMNVHRNIHWETTFK